MDMRKRIEEAKKAAEAEYEARQKAKESVDIDVDDIFDGIDLDDEEELLHGKVADFDKVQRYQKLCQAARWLEANAADIKGIRIGVVNRAEPNAHVTLVFRRLSYLKDDVQRVFAYMNVLAESFFVTCLDDGVVRLSFGINNVWRE